MSHPEDRRSIDELLVRYELEPTIRDIYVEGYSDKVLIEWFLREKEIDDVAIYEVSTVDVPYAKIKSLSLEDNNRGRVITLAFALYDGSVFDFRRIVACVADTDFDNILEKEYECPLLIFTEYTSIEVYLFDSDILAKFFELVIMTFPYDATTVLAELSDVLQDLFLIRLANQELGFGIEPLPLGKLCSVEGSKILLDLGQYIYRYLNNGGKLHQRKTFESTVARYKARLSENPRMQIHGHDFVNLLLLYISKIKKPQRAVDPNYFARSLFGVLEIRHVEEKPLFAELLRRFA